MTEIPTPERTCCFHMKRSMARYKSMTHGCQFTDRKKYEHEPPSGGYPGETEFFEVDGKHYCRFHMPLKDKSGKPTEKMNWHSSSAPINPLRSGSDEWSIFTRGIKNRLDQTLYEGRCEGVADLAGVVFPSPYNLGGWAHAEDEPAGCGELPSIHADGAVFGGQESFYNVSFSGDTSFFGATFEDDANFSATKDGPNFPRMNFSGAKFKGEARFINRKFSEPVDFYGAVFYVAPDFHGAELHQGCTIDKAEFFDVKSLHAPSAYSILKLAMEEKRNWNGMAKFHALEERSLRHQPGTHWFVRFVSWSYDMASEYGQNFWRPFIGLLLLIPAVWFLSYWGVVWAAGVTWDAAFLVEIFKFDLMQMVRPFEAFVQKEPEKDPILSCLAGGWYGMVIILAFLQTFATAGFVTLFILAVRRRFRMA